MPLTRLDNLLSSKTGKYIYVCPDDFNASDALDNRGNSQLRPFVSIQRAFLEVARFSYVPGVNNDRFDQFTIMLSPGPHFIDNRPGDIDTAEIPVFNYDSATDAWNDPAIFDLGNPNNILYKFNGRDGGTTIPRGTSLVGADLRRTVVRPLYVPDPVDTDVPRTSLFNVTGGCYFWQFTIKDAEDVNGPLLGQAYTQPRSTQKSYPLFSHHKITNFVYADREDLGLLYRKISKCFSKYQEAIDDVYTVEYDRIQDTWSSTFSYAVNGTAVFGGEAYKAIQASTNKRPDLEDTYWERLSTTSREFDFRVQENRIVGPVADTIELAEFVLTERSAGLVDVTVTSKINHGFFPGQYVAITNTGINNNLNGVFQVYTISTTNPREFTYRVLTSASALGQIPGAIIIPDPNATVQAEIDSVESASPYVFNVSIRSVWGICGIWADGRKATGFKSMVIAQYTGVSLQKDDRAFIRYDEFSNTWNQASLNDAFATIPYHIKGDAYWKDDWRNFHVKASDDSFIQNVSIFAVGFADHFLLESGGDMSITNSNSNFGNTSMHSKGFKGFAFNQDKGGYITDIVPPKSLEADAQPIKTSYYSVDVQLSKPLTNSNRLYLTGDKANNFLSRPAATINKYRIGARSYIDDTKCEKLYVNVTADQSAGETGATVKSAVLSPQGFKRWSASLTTVSPANLGVGDVDEDNTPNTAADTLAYNLRQDGANLIDANKIFIQAEGFGYILEKYPYLQSIPYNNPNITSETGRYRDARNLILSNRQEIIDYSFTQMLAAFPTFTVPNGDKCKRDLGIVIDAVAADLYDGGNANIVEATKTYFNEDDSPLANGLLGEETQSVYAFNRARDWAKKAISNLLGNTSKISLTSLTSSSTTITATSSTAHGLAIGQQISIVGSTPEAYNIYKTVVISSGFTPTQFRYVVSVAPATTPAIGAFYASTVIIDSQNSVGEARRFKDGAGLVTSNRQEIIDRAAAQIAIDYPDFYYPGDAQTTATSRFKDSYRLIQLNKTAIINTAYAASGGSIPADTAGVKCKRDIGIFIDAVSLDIAQGGGNKYSRKFIQQYFNAAGTSWITGGLQGEETQSNLAFNSARAEMKKAITNQLTIKDLTITADPATGSNTSTASCANVQSAIDTLTALITARITAGNLTGLPVETNGTVPAGELKCKRDIGIVVDAVQQDLFWGGNEFVVGATKEYFTNNTTLLSNGLSGEITQSVSAFNAARDMAKKAITNQLFTKDFSIIGGVSTYGAGGSIIPNNDPTACADTRAAIDSLFGIITSALTAGNLTSLPGTNNGKWDCANVRNSIDTLFSILTTAIHTASVLAIPLSNPGPWSTVSESSKCRRDIGLLVEAVTADLRLGGNENTVNAAESYFTGTGQLNLSGTIASNGVVTGLTSTANLLAGMAVTRTSGAGSFGVNPTILTINSATQITVTQVSGTVTAGAISFIANQLDYIEKERIETLDAFDYVRNLAISAMRNHNTYLSGTSTSGSPIITVSSTNGLVLGMSVRSVATIPTIPGSEQLVNDRLVPINYTTSIPSSAYIKKIGNGSNGLAVNQIQLGAKGSKFDSGVTINANASGSINFFFQLEQGIWTNAIKPSVDPNVIQDYNYTVTNGECASVVENINTYFTAFSTVINNGIGSVAKKVSSLNTGSFARRTTLFTLTDTSSGSAPTDPHHLETGTPVRLVPRVKAGAVVDKRLIRLPRGFDTNTVYYVIAPGRKTDPEDYSNITRFDGVTAGSFQNLMLASSIENAATGIYIYSSETENVDPNVIIDVYQYVLDLSYNLNQYVTKRGDGTTFVTEEPHLFDKPNSSWNINDNQKYQTIFFKPIGNGSLPNGILPNREYFARYINKITLALNCQFEVYDTIVEAIAGANPKNFAAFGGSFYVFSNKKRSPLRFAPEAGNLGGTWYLGTNASKPNTILERIRKTDFVSKDKTPDTWFERISDDRKKEDRVYRLRYVVPKYLKSVREPLRGFIIKSRNDQTRRLLPQKLLIKPTAAGSSIADLSIPNISAAITGKSANREFLGYSNSQHGPLFQSVYDPYNPESISSIDLTPKFRRKVTTDSKITFYIQSAKTVSVGGTNYLEITVFDLGIEEQGYKEKLFTTVKIDVPQGGTGIFVSNTANLLSSDTSNIVTWGGAYKGKGRVHKYFNYENQNYMILKDITFVSTLDYDPTVPTIFTQGSVSAALTAAPNGGRSNIDNYLYATEGANVYTMTPGDTFQAENGNYTIASVTDVDDFENTFYIFDINTIRRRIFGQQDGIYYLTCLRGDIAPFPTGAGVGNNFRDYKFSQPVSKLYPQFYRNDPEWYKQLDSAAIDPPASISAADNYIHGLVTVNDAKSSVTKEGVIDLIKDRGTKRFTFTGNKKIQSQLGGASAGSEARRIPISGDSPYATEGRLYVELRRPSIARSGNHTFEYLGFGPGNYSTGFPARQEVILTDIQDFYAQAKRQNGGIVFYTGLNSNGDLYIGNRKINAITGEETFLESAQLLESEDDNDEIGNFVTTFDGPVTFNDIVTFAAVLPKTNIFRSPIEMDVATVIPGSGGLTAPPAFKIKSNINGAIDDDNLRSNSITGRDTGDIVLTDNRLKVAVIDFNNRGLQDYSVRTAIYQTTPDQLNTFGVQSVSFGTKYPLNTGDILLKGKQVGTTGSVAWIYANNFTTLLPIYKYRIQGFGTGINKARIIWPNNIANNLPYTNTAIGIKSINYQVRLDGLFNQPNNDALKTIVLGAWSILASTFNESNNFVDIITNDFVPTGTFDISNETGITISTSNVAWKEVGIIGAESIRTQTDDIGDYKVGINTVARASHGAYLNAFVESGSTDPRANLDIVGTTFISGKTLATLATSLTNNFKDNSVLSQRTFNAQDNAFLVGGDSATPNNLATLRLSTTSNRLGINTTNAQLNGTADGGWYAVALGVLGDGAFSGKLRVQDDLMVNGGDITTTATTFNFINSNANVVNVAGSGQIVNLFNNTTAQQNINVGNNSTSQSLFIGNASPATLTSTIVTELRIHRNSTDAKVDIATVADIVGRSCDIKIGGAWINTNSKTLIGTRQTILAGELEIGNKYAPGTSTTRIFSQTRTVNIFDGAQTVAVNLAPNASDLKMGSSGGFTTIRNNLNVLSSANVEGNIRLNGGVNAGIITIQRARFNTPASAHVVGSTANPNIDFYKYQTTGRTIDTQGVSQWGSTDFLVSGGQILGIGNIVNTGGASRTSGIYNFLSSTGGTGTGATFNITINADKTYLIDIISAGSGYTQNDILTITNNQLGGGAGGGNFTLVVTNVNAVGTNYFLPISTPGQFDFKIGDLIFIDRDNAASPDVVGTSPNVITGLRNQQYSEILKVVGLTNLTNPNDQKGYRIEVLRAQDGTVLRTDHPQGCILAKFDKQSNASYITGADLDGNGIIDLSSGSVPVNVPLGTVNINIGVAEFGGTLTTSDYLRLSGAEIVKVFATVSTDIQSLIVNDGGFPGATTFKVESTTGNTSIFGNLGVGTGFNRFTVDGNSGNTTVAGTLTTENTLTINGSTIPNTQFFKTTNGGATGIPLRTTFQIDTATGSIITTGSITSNGGDMTFYSADGTTPRLTFVNSSGDFATYGSFSAFGTGLSRFGGPIQIGGTFGTASTTFPHRTDADLTINGGNLTINTNGTEIFKVSEDGSLKVAGIENFVSRTGGFKWEYSNDSVIRAKANTNYFVQASGITFFKLPTNALIGDMIRIIDIGGTLTYNLSLIIRAGDGIKVQNSSDNTGAVLATGIAVSEFVGYNGGEMVVQTPYASFALVYAGPVYPNGNSATPSSLVGWYLTEV